MAYDPYKIVPAVLVVIVQGDDVLLARRVGTTYMDGWFGLPGGHLEVDETLQEGAAREVFEVGLTVRPEDLELFHIYQNMNTPGWQYIGFMFRATRWSGEPKPGEDKVADIGFYNLDNLPDKLIPYHHETLKHLHDSAIKITFTALGSFDPSGK
jgi:8-oxo-dGTP diphosphatase